MRNRNDYRYSPHEISRYRLAGMPEDEITGFITADRAQAIWNLFWLSNPDLDKIPGTGRNWVSVYHPTEGAVPAIVRDVYDDEVLFRKLTLHPDQFIDWFEREFHERYDAYDVLGGDRWVVTVLERAEAAAARMTAANPPMIVQGNVIMLRPALAA